MELDYSEVILKEFKKVLVQKHPMSSTIQGSLALMKLVISRKS
jgi:hypothetical protein